MVNKSKVYIYVKGEEDEGWVEHGDASPEDPMGVRLWESLSILVAHHFGSYKPGNSFKYQEYAEEFLLFNHFMVFRVFIRSIDKKDQDEDADENS